MCVIYTYQSSHVQKLIIKQLQRTKEIVILLSTGIIVVKSKEATYSIIYMQIF